MGNRVLTKQLLKRVRILETTRCWEFQGAKDKDGYGVMFYEGKTRQAHKLFYELLIAPLAPGEKLYHLPLGRCIGTSCCNPAHLRKTDPRLKGKVCKNGHPLTDENVVIETRKNGYIVKRCRMCRRKAWREWVAERREGWKR